jgi:hypothetical protein
MPTPSLDEHFGTEYRHAWDRAYQFALLTHGTEAALVEKVSDCVHDIADALVGKDTSTCLLALTHIVREHYLLPMRGL